jgi:hypothetical protein
MAEASVTLTHVERKCLVELLEMCLKETQNEEHRTRTISYRDHILQRENLIGSLLQKLGKASR